MRVKITLALLVSNVLLLPGLSCQLQVSVYPGASMSQSDANAVLTEGSRRIINTQTHKGCGLVLGLAEPLHRDQRDSIPVVDEMSYKDVCAGQSEIHVVPSIKWCNGYVDGLAYGCSQPNCEIVIWTGLGIWKDATESLWMHEYGHTKNLQHPYVDYDNLLMNANLSAGQFNVDNNECTQLLGRQETVTKVPTEKKKSGEKIGIEEFVRHIYIHGFPVEKARLYTLGEINRVVPWLDDPQEEMSWPNIIMLMGVAGNSDYVEPLIQFVEKPTGENGNAHQARISVLMALGQIIRWMGAKRGKSALEYLASHASPTAWRPSFIGKGDTSELSEYAIIALGESGSPEAAFELQRLLLRQEPFFQQASIKRLLLESIDLNISLR